MGIGVGGDPELAIINAQGLAVAAHARKFPPKQNPQMVSGGSYVLRDGWAVELNPHWSYCRESFQYYTNDCLVEARRHLKDDESLVAVPFAVIDKAYLTGAPEDVCISGCDKSWNAYTGVEAAPELRLETVDFRTFGGHLHISADHYENHAWLKNPKLVHLFIKMVDFYVGLPSTYILGSDLAGMRRKFYGQAGEFRYQNHFGKHSALEYRVLGPEVYSHKALLSLHLGLLRYCFINADRLMKSYDGKYQDQIRSAINAGVSHESLLDLIVPIKSYLPTKATLQLAKKYFQKRMHKPITTWKSPAYGWDSWAGKHGIDIWKYRD